MPTVVNGNGSGVRGNAPGRLDISGVRGGVSKTVEVSNVKGVTGQPCLLHSLCPLHSRMSWSENAVETCLPL